MPPSVTAPRRRRAATPARATAYAVLRRVFEHGAWADRALHAAAGRLPPPSVPLWRAGRWSAGPGRSGARALRGGVNEPAESALRANTLVTTRDEVLAALPGHAAPDDPDAVVLDAPFDAHGHPLFDAGAY